MIQHWTTCPPTLLDGIRAFLLQEVYASKVWETVCTFQPLEDLHGVASAVDPDGPFIQYLKIILTLTDYERSEAQGNTEHEHIPSVTSLQTSLEEARKRTMKYVNVVDFQSRGSREAFHHVVEAYHQAGLLFGCQVLFTDTRASDVRNSARQQLFEHLRAISFPELIAQDLTWPVFIAGTECQGNTQDEHLVQDQMREIMKLSGVLRRPNLLCFLQHLWSLQVYSASTTWISLARTYAERGEPILII
jgi:hypothetical protein